MFELNCDGVIPGCKRVIRAETQAEVFRRAVRQAQQMGVDTLTPTMVEELRERTTELAH
jgi:predicted small metal-binding protein